MLSKEQYFGMYVGKEIINFKHCLRGKLITVALTWFEIDEQNIGKTILQVDNADCKLILRPFEDMTEEEKFEHRRLNIIANTYTDEKHSHKLTYDFKQEEIDNLKRQVKEKSDVVSYLISIGIDVFNLHSKGFAVYESEVGNG